MASNLISYRVFIASPGGLSDERISFRENIEQHNKSDAYERGIHFYPVGWEETLSSFGRPQSLINIEIQRCDYFVLVIHDRWGSNPGGTKYSSGTEEEFHLALDCFNDDSKPMKQLVLLFKDISPDKLSDPGPQLSQVLAFRKEREEKKDLLYTTFDSPTKFSQIITTHLSRWVREHEQAEDKKNSGKLSIKTSFDTNQFQWLESYDINGRWDEAISYAHQLFNDGKLLEADFIYSQVYRQSNEPIHSVEYGKFLRKRYKLHHAEEVLTKSIQMATNIKDRKCLGYATRQLGRVYEFQGKIPKALAEFQKSLNIYETIGDVEGIARTNMDMGFALSRNNKSQEAIEYLNLGLSKFESINNKIGIGESLSYLGLVYKNMGDFNKAETYHLRALTYLTSSEKINPEDIAVTKSNLGTVKRLKNEYKEALGYHQEALEFYKKGSDLRALSREYANIGVILRRQGEFDEAILMHEKALELEEETLNERGKGIQLSNLGLNHFEKGDYGKAEIYLNQAMKISIALADRGSQALQMKHLSRLALKQNEFNAAEELVKKSLKIDIEGNNRFGEAQANRLLGDIHKHRGIEDFQKYYQEALDIFKSLGLHHHIVELQTMINPGIV